MREPHQWTHSDELLAYAYYRGAVHNEQMVANEIGTPISRLKLRLIQYKKIDRNEEGWSEATRKAKVISEMFEYHTKEELKTLARMIIRKKFNRRIAEAKS